MCKKKLYKILLVISLGFIAGTITHAQTFPVIAGITSSAKTGSSTTHTIALPEGIQAGDLLIIFWADANTNSSLDIPVDWNELYNQTSNFYRHAAFYKSADGSEGTSIEVTAGNEESAHTSYRILAGTYDGNPIEGGIVISTGSNPNPPGLSVPWGVDKTLWIAASHSNGANPNQVSKPQNGYDDLISGYTGSTGDSDARMMTAHRFNEIDLEEPDVFSLSSSGTIRWGANTVAIRGANISPPYKPAIKLMPLGDSITRGQTGASDSIGGAGYRKPLIDLLESLGYVTKNDLERDFNFVGTNVTSNITVVGDFDKDNEGHSSYHAFKSDGINSMFHDLDSWLNLNNPDVILLHIGTNDIGTSDDVATIISEVEDLLDLIYGFNSDISVILAKIINRAIDNPAGSIQKTNLFNSALQTMAEQRITNGDNLYLVDAGANFVYTIDPNPPVNGYMEDYLHPNDSGHVEMARIWFNKLRELLTPTLASPPNQGTNPDTSVTFTWYPALGANSYHLQVANDENFTSIFDENSSITDTFAVVGVQANTQYYWRVRAKINTGASPWSDVWELAQALPVELSAFNVRLNGRNAELYWKTETEVNNFGFEIERRNPPLNPLRGGENSDWEKIGFVDGHGNSNSPKDYSFTDNNLFGSTKFKYRLKQIDTDGTFAYSDVVEITVIPFEFELSQNFPNPFNPATKIEFSLPYASRVRIDVYDILGQHIKTLINEELEEGYHNVVFDASQLPAGAYIYRLLSEDFVHTKKMILIK